ncbi:hypothetical protein L0B53_15495 [Vibrio sp. SS-MA-C1-2]|uniref:hypothetical protein n=1 Tax=Vibrio sp. SS-MA-C1-2 TaxID=2908646 RepID=UPI001F15DDE1|nr:hypothetical protein [Vibrio sp. SS-MA-C1-2]UJF18410.1 hypothetical protein L0B53_15495 [Vibrio sp. SS-MA-C1-2]
MKKLITSSLLILTFIASNTFAETKIDNHHKTETLAQVSKKLSDPTSNVWALFTSVNFTGYSGSDVTGDKYGQNIVFQPIMPFHLTEDVKLITRPVISFNSQPALVSEGHTERHYGLSDLQLPLMVSPKSDTDFSWAFGPSFILPTNTGDLEKGHVWQGGAAALMVWKPKGYVLGTLNQYWRNISSEDKENEQDHGQINLFLIKSLGGAQEIGITPTITYDNKINNGGGKWNVPLGLTYSFMHRFGSTPAKVQVGLEKSVIKNDEYGQDWNLKINIIPVVNVKMDPLF